MFNLKTGTKNTHMISKISNFLVLLFITVLNIFLIAQNSNAVGQIYSVTLPQKVDGIEKLEYVVNRVPQGSTAGKTSIDLASEANIYFLLKIESTGYSQLLAKNVKVVSNEGTSLSLKVFEYDENQNIKIRDVADDELIDPEQTYATASCILSRNETFSIQGVEIDKFDTTIKLENTDIPINEALDVTYNDQNENTVSATFNAPDNSYIIKNIPLNSSLKTWVNKKPAYSQSSITFLSNDPYMIYNENDNSLVFPGVTSNINTTVQNVSKNQYTLSFTTYSDALFKYKKDGSSNDFEPATNGSFTVAYGESYSFICETSNENTLSGKEITANGIAIRAVSGVYSLPEISENINIAINGENDTLYKITLPSSEKGITITDKSGNELQNTNVKYGESFEFKVSPADAYTQNIDYALIYAVPKSKLTDNDYNTESNPSEAESYLLTPSVDGVFTAASIKEPMAVIVKNLDINTYKVTLPQTLTGASYAVTASDYVKQLAANKYSVVYGKSMEITLTADSGKSVANVTVVSDNNPSVQISKNDNKYTIENITKDTDIIISNITVASYDITFSGTGALCKDENGNTFENNKASVIHETGTLKFKVESGEGYEIENVGINVSLKSGSASLTAPSGDDKYYTLSNVTENTVLEITGIMPKTFNVSLSSDINSIEFMSTSGNNEVLTENNPVSYGSDFEFTVASSTGENVPNVTLETNNQSEVTPLGNNVYSLKSVSQDTSVVALQSSETEAPMQMYDTAPPSEWQIARKIQLVSKPSGICNISFVDENDPDNHPDSISPSTLPSFPYAYSLYGDLSSNITLEYNYPYNSPSKKPNFIGFKFYYDAELQNEITNSMYIPDNNYRISIDNSTTTDPFNYLDPTTGTDPDGPYSGTVPLNARITVSKNFFDYYLNYFYNIYFYNYDYSFFGGGINDNVLSIFDTIYVAAEFENVQPETTNINFSPPPQGANYYNVLVNNVDESTGNTYVKEGDKLDKLKYTIDRGGKFSFIVRLDEGYEMDDNSIRVYPEGQINLKQVENVWPSENKYCYELTNSFVSDVQVYVENVRKKTYTTNFSGDGTNFLDENNNQFLNKTFEYGDSFSFTTEPKEGYKNDGLDFKLITSDNEYSLTIPTAATPETEIIIDTIKLTARCDSQTLKITYTLSDVKGNFNIKTTRNRQQFNVYFEPSEGIKYYITSGGTPVEFTNFEVPQVVEYERNFSFLVKAQEGYDIRNMVVTSNHETLDFINGKYTIKSIAQDSTVRVENISKLTNKITFTQYEGLIFKDTYGNTLPSEKQVDYDEQIEFKSVLASAYSNSDIKVYAEYSSGGSKEFEKLAEPPSDPYAPYFDTTTGIYKIKAKENIRIYADNMSLNSYNVKLVKTAGISYYNEQGTEKLVSPAGSENDDFIIQNVTYGNSFGFKVVAEEGYDISNLEIYSKKSDVSSARAQMFPSSEVYTLENVTQDYTITAENISKSTYQIEFRVVEGGRCIDDHGNEIGSTVSVKHGDNFSFKISLDSAYSNATPTVTVKGTDNVISPNADKSYTISNITSNKIIEIINITKNSYKATFQETEGVVYKTSKNKPFSGSLDVEYGSTLYFKISLLDAYDKSSPWVLLNGEKTLGENGGVYSLDNISDNVEIIVKNVIKNPEEVTMDDVNNVPDEITSESDVDAVVKATQTYLGLSDEEKSQVLSIAKLENAQQKAGSLNHKSGDIIIDGVDWNIKLVVTPFNDDKSKTEEFSAKVDRRSVLSLYELSLVDTLTNTTYEVPYGQKVSVVIPAPDLTGYKNTVIVHEKSSGSIEYLDVNITNGLAQFQTSSFSLFGVAAKKTPNYAENPSEITISVSSLVKNEDELQTLLGEGLVSQLGNLIEDDDVTPTDTSDGTSSNTSNGTSNGTTNGTSSGGTSNGTANNNQNSSNSTNNTDSTASSSSNNISSELSDVINKIDLNKAYDWAVNNELVSVILILVIGSILIAIIIIINKRQNKKEP